MTTSIIIVRFLVVMSIFAIWSILRRNNKRKIVAAAVLAVAIIGFIDILLGLGIETTFRYNGVFPIGTVSIIYYSTYAGIIFAVFRYYVAAIELLPDYSDRNILQTAVSEILDSESFLTALRGTLPRGKDDEQYGLDYIPFMLHSIDERRKRATRSARLFLFATVIAALAFSSVVMYFGYILVNEAAAGSARSLAELRSATQRVSDMLESMLPNYFSNSKFQKEVAPALAGMVERDPGAKNKEIQGQIRTAVNQAKETGNFDTLRAALKSARTALSRESVPEQNFAAAVADADDKLTSFINSQSSALSELPNRTNELKLLIARTQETLDKPEYRTSEIIKRLALGIVISTFFLALLRYLGTLYRTRYIQVLEAEKDDFAVRRFYVALKSSLTNDDQRKAVLASFMAGPNNGTAAKEEPDDSIKQEFELIKELMQALSKKF